MENRDKKKAIKSFQDFEVYQRLYKLMFIVLKKIVPKIPEEEKYDLKDQVRRSCNVGPALLPEGFAKRYQSRA